MEKDSRHRSGFEWSESRRTELENLQEEAEEELNLERERLMQEHENAMEALETRRAELEEGQAVRWRMERVHHVMDGG